MRSFSKSKRNLILYFLNSIVSTDLDSLIGDGCEYRNIECNGVKNVGLKLTTKEIHNIQEMYLEGELFHD